MPFHGKNTAVQLDNVSGVLVDISAYSRSASPNESIDTADTTNFGQNDKTYILGQSDEKFSLGGTFELAFLSLLRAIKAQQQADPTKTATLRFAPAGLGTGKYYSDREVLVTSIQVSAATGDLVTMSAEFQRTGATTEGTLT